MWLIELVLLNSANLICRSTDISKYFRESLGIRDNDCIFFSSQNQQHRLYQFTLALLKVDIPMI